MSSELAKVLRLLKPQKISALTGRSDPDLPFVDAAALAGPALMLDTCVYLDVLQGKAPHIIRSLLNTRHVFHSSVCVAELVHVFGRLAPTDARTKSTLAAVEALIAQDIPKHRLSAPDIGAWEVAGVLAGILARTQGHKRDERGRLLNDALIYAQATSMGCIVLTRNVRDFDLLHQLMPRGDILLYR